MSSTTSSTKRSTKVKSSTLNFQRGINDTLTKENTKGTRPTTAPTSITEVLTQVFLHICKKSIFFDTNLKVAIYLGALFLVSLIGDFVPFPKTYLSRSDNFLNVFFVKVGWAWTLLLTTPFLSLTSLILCCGDKHRLFWHHLTRILVATVSWFVWTKLFNIIEAGFGRCNNRAFDSKSTCLKNGHFWNGFDISGHAFILVYSSLVLIEEARPIINWESIREHLRNENHNRSIQESSNTPLKALSNEELKNVNDLYTKYTPLIRIFFIGMTILQLLWDVMLAGTCLYYHKMIEKVVGGIIAILVWFFTYRFWYSSTNCLPDAPGKGLFNYTQGGAKGDSIPLKRRSSITMPNGKQMPKFGAAGAAYRNAENLTPRLQ